jgi:hypothetical protein
MRWLASAHPESPFEPQGPLGWLSRGGDLLRWGLRWGAHHTGLPVMLVAAIALVMSGHIVKRTIRFGVEVAVALGLLFAATRLGWIVW